MLTSHFNELIYKGYNPVLTHREAFSVSICHLSSMGTPSIYKDTMVSSPGFLLDILINIKEIPMPGKMFFLHWNRILESWLELYFFSIVSCGSYTCSWLTVLAEELFCDCNSRLTWSCAHALDADTANLTGAQTFTNKNWAWPVQLLCIIMFDIILGPIKAQKFLRRLLMGDSGKCHGVFK